MNGKKMFFFNVKHALTYIKTAFGIFPFKKRQKLEDKHQVESVSGMRHIVDCLATKTDLHILTNGSLI